MSFEARDVKDRVVQYPRRYQLVEVSTGIYDLVPVTGTVTEQGTAINKAYLQPIEDGLEVALEKTGDGKDVIVTFTEAATEADIASGEKLSVMFGKILKKFKSIVPISLGGTGASTVAGARNALGLGNTSGALPVANGGTGSTTAANARTALGVPPTSHANSDSTYGLGTTANHGHVKTINNLTQASHIDGTALAAYQGKVLKDLIDAKGAISTGTVTYTDSIAPSSILTKNIPIGNDKKQGRLLIGEIGILFSTIAKNTFSSDGHASYTRMLNAAEGLAWSSDSTGSASIKLRDAYISGTNLILVFYNSGTSTYTLNAIIDWEVW